MVAGQFASMTDDDLYNLYKSSRSVDMPNHIADIADETQRFVYKTNLNTKPQVLDSTAFNNYLKQNGISQAEVMARSVNSVSYNSGGVTYRFSGDQLNDMVRYGSLNYIGGKRGGQVYGAGTYFAMTGGSNTGYGGTTMRAVLSPNAKIISRSSINSEWNKFTSSRPKMRNTNPAMSVKALMMGYNVITSYTGSNLRKGTGGNYYNIIDRSALVIEK